MVLNTRNVYKKLPKLLRRFLWFSRMAPRPPEIPGLFTDYENGRPIAMTPIEMWNETFIRKNLITRECLVTKVHWYKGRKSTQREFLRFDISSPDKVHTAILIAERGAGDSSKGKDRLPGTTEPTDATTPPANPTDSMIGPGIPSVTITPPFASPDVASDSTASSADETSPNIARGKSTATDRKKKLKAEGSSENASSSSSFISRGLANDEIVHATLDSIAGVPMERKCKDSDFISALTFPEDAGPSANKIATLLVVTSALEPMYRLMNMQCYWFVATVFEALKCLFPGAKQDITGHNGGTWYQVRIPKKASVDAACRDYDKAQTALDAEIEEECRVEQEREEARRREIEELRAAAEREREQRRAAEEGVRIAKEGARIAEEGVRNAEEGVRIAEEERQKQCQAAEEETAKLHHLRRELEALRAEVHRQSRNCV
ncbi:hypothetical protein BKA83DRAFT_4237317 [Pisolithus microcarpus]|nr:hypothetical protein BKA83DRAFT_4237317 [Pisolithus microcarpus]